jgi:hypothetical protein
VATTKLGAANSRKLKKVPVKQKAGKFATGRHTPAEEEKLVTVDRRCGDRRTRPDRRQKSIPIPAERRVLQRREKVNRRRQIDPTTCERDYSQEEIEFMNAMDEYKRTSGRMFPTCSEVLEVLRKLGYEKRPCQETVEIPPLVIAEALVPPPAETAVIV